MKTLNSVPSQSTFVVYLTTIIGLALVNLLMLACFYAKGQTTIGGIINTYTKVTSLSNCSCPTQNCQQITVSSASGFATGDKVLIMQMKGAKVDTTNSPSHGSIVNLYDAGNYEYATISGVSGNVITTKYPLKETYFTSSSPADSAYVQLIRVATYTNNVSVTTTLTPQAWSAASGTGGVLVLETTGTLTLNANITATGYGFSGARKLQVAVSCDMDTAFYYQSTIWNYASCTSCGYVYDDAATRRVGQASYGGCGTTCFTNRMYSGDNKSAAYKGEGVAANYYKKTFSNGNVAYFDKGKGRWGNGGGGGGNHNAGGGGGAGYGAGGFGGKMYNNSTTACPTAEFATRRGYGGAGLTSTASKIFMGGGGGEGHNNGGNGSTGVAGGGIIIITAASITNGASYTITANGADNTFVAFGDGSGGGGGGGTILLNIGGGYINAVTVSAKGGKGGDHNNNNCHGTGGGGGGGLIWFVDYSLPANVTANVSGGANGVQVAPTIDCGDINWGATAGTNGTVFYGLAAGASAFINANTCNSSLPVKLSLFTAMENKGRVELNWTTESEQDNDYFVIERSLRGNDAAEVVKVKGAGNSSTAKHYHATDFEPEPGMSYYRLKQVNFDGKVSYSKWVDVSVARKYTIETIPNPVNAENIKIVLPDIPESLCRIHITDEKGKSVYDHIVRDKMTESYITLNNVPIQNAGLYYLIVEMDGNIYSQKISLVTP